MFSISLLWACTFFSPGSESKEIVRIVDVVSRLGQISMEKRIQLSQNPNNLAPSALNQQIPQIHAVELDNAYPAPEETGALRVVAWNLERGTHWREGVDLLVSHPALRGTDILFLSEMDIGMARSGCVHTARKMANALSMNYAYVVEFLELPRGAPEMWNDWATANPWGYHGNAILSRYPLENVRAVRFPGIEKWYGSGQHRLGGRNALFAEVTVAGLKVTLGSTHLESGLADHEIRAQQSRWICAEIRKYAQGQPVILGGDLNAIHTQKAIQVFREEGFLVDQCNVLKMGTMQRVKRDRSVSVGGAHIDYLAVKGLEVVPLETSPMVVPAVYPLGENHGESLGDHALVTALIQLKPSKEREESSR